MRREVDERRPGQYLPPPITSFCAICMPFYAENRGCLPTYEQVGPTSTVLLVICRLLQGVSVGGQLPASLIYTVEMSPREHWGYYGSLVMMSGEHISSFSHTRVSICV